ARTRERAQVRELVLFHSSPSTTKAFSQRKRERAHTYQPTSPSSDMAVGVSERLFESPQAPGPFVSVGGGELFYTNPFWREPSMNAPKVLKRLTAVVLLFSRCSALLLLDNIKAQASNSNTATATATATATTTVDKISPELRQLIQSGQGSTRVKVIVQSTSSPSTTSGGLLGGLGGLLGGLVQTVGGVVQGLLSALNITLLDVRADSVSVLAADPSVSYISLDSQVRTFGHVTNTTGTQQSRAQKTALGLNYSLDGSGVSIAILDSGIDVTHRSF